MNSITKSGQRDPNIALKFEHVSCRFSRTDGSLLTVFEDLNVAVRSGEFVAIIGPSGSGKSTILNMISGLVKPSLGTIQVCGVRPYEAAQKHKISYVPQSPALLSWRTARQNISLPYELAHRKEPSGVVTSLLELMQLSGFESSYPHQLSGGMRSRVSVARALSLKPDVLLLDEPFASLDEITADDVARTIIDIWLERRLTVVMVTHNITQAVMFAQRVLVLGRRPKGIVADISIDLPSPRTDAILESAAFGRMLSKIRNATHFTQQEQM